MMISSTVNMEPPGLTSQASLVSQPSSSLQSSLEAFFSDSPGVQLLSEVSTRLRNAASLPATLERKESFHSQLSSPSSSNISAFISFAGSCQFPGIQGASFKCLNVLQSHHGHINALALSGNILYTSSSSSSNRIHAWKIPEMNEIFNFGRGKGGVKFILAPGSSQMILSAHQDHKIRAWKIMPPDNKSKVIKHIATLPTIWNKFLTFFSSRSYVKIRRHIRGLWIQHSDMISVLAMSHDGALIFSGSWDKTFKVWRVSDFKCLESVEAHEDAVNSLVVSRAGFLYTCSADSKVKVWERSGSGSAHALVATLEGHKSSVNALSLSSDEQLLYSASSDRRIMVWEREDSASHMCVVGGLRGHRQAVLCLAVADEYLCSGSADKSVRVWRRGENNVHACVALLEGHLGAVKALCVNPVSASSGDDYVADHDSLQGGEDECETVRGSVQYAVYSGSLDSDVRVWIVSPDESFPTAELHRSLQLA